MLVVAGADVVVVFGVVVRDSATAGTVAPGAEVEPVLLMFPVAGVVVVAGVAGSVVRGVGTGGNGFDMTLAIRSVRPASDWLWRNL